MANFSELQIFCPSEVEFYTNTTDPAMVPVKMAECRDYSHLESASFQQWWLYGRCANAFSFCHVLIEVPSNILLRVRIEYVKPPVSSPRRFPWDGLHHWMLAGTAAKPLGLHDFTWKTPHDQPSVYLLSTRQYHLLYINHPPLRVTFDVIQPRPDFTFTSELTGFVGRLYQGEPEQCVQLKAPYGHVTMASIAHHYISGCKMTLSLHAVESGNTHETVDRYSSYSDREVKLYRASGLKVCDNRASAMKYEGLKPCFELIFSFHPEHRVPQRLSSGLYNCSVQHYWRFQQHLDCNLEVECEDGRDETGHCPFSSAACHGWVASHNKCYKLFTSQSGIQSKRARDICRSQGLDLASLTTSQELNDFLKIFFVRSANQNLIGLTSRYNSKPFMYRYMLSWLNKKIVYKMNHLIKIPQLITINKQHYYWVAELFQFRVYLSIAYSFFNVKVYKFTCEKPAQNGDSAPSQSIGILHEQQSLLAFRQSNQSLVICPDRHVTHAFLSCDAKSRCGQVVCVFVKGRRHGAKLPVAAPSSAAMLAMYPCTSGNTRVPFSLLCDWRQDCADNSDESFCHHPDCRESSCSSGQCLLMTHHCNQHEDCLDGSDEINCPEIETYARKVNMQIYKGKQNNSFVIHLDGRGFFTQREMNRTDPCPTTHYRCTKEWFYCLPVYTRCNGFFDCVFEEDERDCDTATCPGLYRCRGSTVCVHADHLCDGWPQCPQRDDEWLCDVTCPAQCLCLGLSFRCNKPFSAHLFPQLRYLDASGSGMAPSDLRTNLYIVHLSLAHCYISFLPDVSSPNLQLLDLSYNEITTIFMSGFLHLQNLQTLILQGNPLMNVTVGSSPRQQSLLRKIDLSGTLLEVLDTSMFSNTPGIQSINASHAAIHSIRTDFLLSTPQLRELDVRGNSIRQFPDTLLLGLDDLASVFASDYRWCCQTILPSITPKPLCIAPLHHLSSCDDLLQSQVYRLSFWCLAVLASLANLLCMTCHCVKTSTAIRCTGPVAVCMASLQCADLCMAVYSSVIVSAQETFHSHYVHFEAQWKSSLACQVAGFLCLLSSEVSTLTILLLTVDQLMLLCWPHSTCRFSKGSAAVACGVAWCVGSLLASLPLLPALSDWPHYGHSAVCSVLLQHTLHVQGTWCFNCAVLVLNVSVCLVVCVSQLAVYRAVPRQPVLIRENPVPPSVDVVMRMAASNCAAWLCVATTTVLASAGVAGSDKAQVAMAVMVLPLNSAVNPLLCLWQAVTYRRRQKQEDRLLSWLQSRRNALPKSTGRAREN